MRRFGLIGKNIAYSFSRVYFADKFQREHISDAIYQNFDIQSVNEFPLIVKEFDDLAGFNVTIPFKEQIIPFLDGLDTEAREINAVNTIKINSDGSLVGFNTDCYGFEQSLLPCLKPHHHKALILGTGGASKAVRYVLEKRSIEHCYVSRNPSTKQLHYTELDAEIIAQYPLIINCTPLGTHPNIEDCPDIPYQFLSSKHLLYDLIYNPSKTTFLAKGEGAGATIINGQRMLELQAERAWTIWNH